MSINNIGIIGARGHIDRVLGELEQTSPRVSAISPGGDSLGPIPEWCAKHGHSPRVFDNWQELIGSGVEALVVCGPFEKHAEMAIAAIERGIHVLCEKPAALTFAELDRLRAVCAKNPSVHLSGMMFSRYDTGFFTAWKLVREGAIGDVRLINAQKSYRLGKRARYFHDRKTYGGTIPWVGSHGIDWVMWFMGVPFESVTAVHSAVENGGNGTMERSALCQFTLAGGRMAGVSIDVFRPQNAPTHGDDRIRIIGTTGLIEARTGFVSLINESNDGSQPVAAACDRKFMVDFVNHAAGTGASLIDTVSTLALTDACVRAVQSADENRPVRFG